MPSLDVGFTLNGQSFTAETVSVTHDTGGVHIVATHADPGGIYNYTMDFRYAENEPGSAACGSVIVNPSRSVTFSKWFDDGGQAATDEEYMSGLGTDTSACTSDITTASPPRGSASGLLDDTDTLTGEGGGSGPATFSLTWQPHGS